MDNRLSAIKRGSRYVFSAEKMAEKADEYNSQEKVREREDRARTSWLSSVMSNIETDIRNAADRGEYSFTFDFSNCHIKRFVPDLANQIEELGFSLEQDGQKLIIRWGDRMGNRISNN